MGLTGRLKIGFLIGAHFIIVFHNVTSQHTNEIDDSEMIFRDFMSTYKKYYTNSSREYTKRLKIFKQNLKLHTFLNSKRTQNESAIYGITKFSDLSPEEFRAKHLSGYVKQNSSNVKTRTEKWTSGNQTKSLPNKIDWRDKGIVTAVRNQHACGGCWGFAVVETMESLYALASGDCRQLSIQQVLDCSFGFHDILSSCRGGDTCHALQWINDTDAHIVDESVYPLKDQMQVCSLKPHSQPGVVLTNFTCENLASNEKAMLMTLAFHGPVAVAVDATNWQNYLGGIVQFHCGGVPNNHAVTVVGYDLTGNIPYYIVKNSWGTNWGLDGYLHVKFGANVCGIVREVSTVDVSPKRQTS